MKFRKTLLVTMLLSVAALPALAQDFKLKFQSSDPAGNPTYMIEQEWAQRVSDASGGRLSIEMLPVDSVVSYNETHDAVGAGILGGHITAVAYASGKDPAFALIGNTVGAWSSPYEMLRWHCQLDGIDL
ncbi:hypothetical protein Q4577_21920 [Marinovum sp. 2_MG-2023]|uniref:hypothetical protein n=1 Tax=unclassified Marinovum TaxID=2647166 RepID=UPI0026E17BB7|nr:MULTISPECIES: hypothetical protein [unclassified Marinovum]MDO6732688.1 hypothetical protein [Marinovum sp. 2_MG-2023]MDO6781961.1 hypothetical protein [Marinovum sp. 1_MG-2023]